ncbi:MAG: PQQ-dependent sugar dehydrogenase [Candidatus Eisenbacteria bacterium]
MTRSRNLALLLTSLAAGLLLVAARAHAAVALPPGYHDFVVASGIDQPTAVAFLPDGRALVTEQVTGKIRLVIGGSLSPAPLVTVSGLTANGGERGLLAIAVDPGWPARPYVYVHATVTGNKMQLIRYTATGTLTGGTSSSLALGSPYIVLDNLADLATNHNGGALQFGLDGRLYYSLGDDADGCQAQDSTTLHGAVLRLDVSALPSGAGGPPARSALVPADNPWAGGPSTNARLEWAYGLRNPFRFVVDSKTGLLYLSDVGQDTWEEIDEITAGFNGGWPFREGPALYTGAGCSEPGGVGSGAYDPPIDSYDHGEGVVIIAAGVIRTALNPAWPAAWDGNVLYADYYSGFLRMIGRAPGGGWQRITVTGQPDPLYFATGLTNPVDFTWGPGGDLYWLAQFDDSGQPGTGELHRIHAGDPTGVATLPPPASPQLSVAPNPAPDLVALRFALPVGGTVRLTVLDPGGRVVARVLDGALPAGSHVAHWDGRDPEGRAAAAGIYLVRLETPSGRVTARVARIR